MKSAIVEKKIVLTLGNFFWTHYKIRTLIIRSSRDGMAILLPALIIVSSILITEWPLKINVDFNSHLNKNTKLKVNSFTLLDT